MPIVSPDYKRKSHSENTPRGGRKHLKRICGVDVTAIHGVGESQPLIVTAHAIARAGYTMLKYQVEYDPLSVNEYQKQYDAQQVKYMKKKAAKLGYTLVPT